MQDTIRHAEPSRACIAEYPFAGSFFDGHNVATEGKEEHTVEQVFADFVVSEGEDAITTADQLLEQLGEHVAQMLLFLADDLDTVSSLTLLPGAHKDGSPEGFDSITISTGDVISIVGPTGSGKSRLLADIEWIAQGDTPTGRTVLLDGQVPDRKWRFSPTHKLVAQLSQNMNFVMDLTVQEFLEMHAESRLIEDADTVVNRIMDAGQRPRRRAVHAVDADHQPFRRPVARPDDRRHRHPQPVADRTHRRDRERRHRPPQGPRTAAPGGQDRAHGDP